MFKYLQFTLEYMFKYLQFTLEYMFKYLFYDFRPLLKIQNTSCIQCSKTITIYTTTIQLKCVFHVNLFSIIK